MAIKTFSIPYWTNDLRTWTLLYRAIANGYETAFMCDARAEHTQKLFCRALLSRTVVKFFNPKCIFHNYFRLQGELVRCLKKLDYMKI